MPSPNVVVILADDLGIGDLEPYDSTLIRTPAIARLAREGVVCDNMYAAAATDTPSRAGLLTGRYGARYNLPASLRPGMTRGLPASATTIATLLRQNGYSTGLFGQWRLGGRRGQHPRDHGFDRFAGTLYGTDVTPLSWYDQRDEVDPELDSSVAARRITDEAAGFIDSHRNDPFFAVLSYLTPHAPYAVPKESRGRSAAGVYGDLVEELDTHIGTLLRGLKRTGAYENTVVIVTSDNGPLYEGRTQHRRGRKPEVYDGGVRVPFVASWPGVTRPVRDRTPRSLLDLTPTLCSLAGANPPAGLDGEDMARLLDGGSPPDRGPVYLFFEKWLNAVRSEKWKLHVAFGDDQDAYMPQLFDVAADIRETYNLATLHPDVVTRLRRGLERVRDDVAAEARRKEGVLR